MDLALLILLGVGAAAIIARSMYLALRENRGK